MSKEPCIRATTPKDILSTLCAYACGAITEQEAEELVEGANGALRAAVEHGVNLAAVNTLGRYCVTGKPNKTS